MQQFLDYLMDIAKSRGPGVVAAILVLIIGWIAAGIVSRFVRRGMDRAKVDATLVGFAANMVYFALLALVIITALGRLGVPTTSFAAVIGAAALAVGFALQGSLANFAAGVLLILFRPFSVGDYVEAGGVAGTIEEIQIFSTRFKTPDNKAIIVPNASITGADITNYSANPTRRLDLVFGIGYDDDIKKAKALLEKIISDDERVLNDPAPTVAVLELADSSVNFAVRPWVNAGDYWPVKFDLTEKVKLEFDANDISIPYPQRDVHLYKDSAA